MGKTHNEHVMHQHCTRATAFEEKEEGFAPGGDMQCSECLGRHLLWQQKACWGLLGSCSAHAQSQGRLSSTATTLVSPCTVEDEREVVSPAVEQGRVILSQLDPEMGGRESRPMAMLCQLAFLDTPWYGRFHAANYRARCWLQALCWLPPVWGSSRCGVQFGQIVLRPALVGKATQQRMLVIYLWVMQQSSSV